MPSPAYTFYLNKLHIDSKTSPGDYVDKDVVVFAVIWNGQVFAAPASNPAVGAGSGSQSQGVNNPFYTDGYIGLVENSNDIVLCSLPNPPAAPNEVVPAGTDLTASWVVGPLNIADEDSVTVFYSVTNLSYFKGNPGPAYLKIVGGELASLAAFVAIGIAATPPPVDIGAAIAAAVLAAIGGVVALIGEIWGDIFPGQPNCNGPVLVSPDLSFTGAQLEQTVGTAVPNPQEITQFTTTIVNTGLSSTVSSNCWTPNTDVTWSIMRDISSLLVFPATPPMRIRPLIFSSNPQNWGGVWGDGPFTNNSRITCTINYTGSGITGETAQDRINSYAGGLIGSIRQEPTTFMLLGQDPRTTREASLSVALNPPITRDVLRGPPEIIPVSARYSAEITEHLGSWSGPVAENIAAQNLVEIPMLALPLPQNDIYPPAEPVLIRPVPVTVSRLSDQLAEPSAGSTPAATAHEPIAVPREPVSVSKIPTQVDVPVPLIFVASLVASSDVSLHLYGEFGPDGKVGSYKVRYVRTSDTGELVTDVMLSPVEQMPS